MRRFRWLADLARTLAAIIDPEGDPRFGLHCGIQQLKTLNISPATRDGFDLNAEQIIKMKGDEDAAIRSMVLKMHRVAYHRGRIESELALRNIYRLIYGEDYNG